MDISILGGGFGMYGYLPASIENGYTVHTLSKYREIIGSRSELSKYRCQLNFHENEESLVKKCKVIVIARDPQSQFEFLQRNVGNQQHLFLEKPLGANLIQHKKILDILEKHTQRFSVGYLFPYTEWYKKLKLEEKSKISIVWKCPVRANSWKSKLYSDSGLFSYFGVHFIPLLFEVNKDYEACKINLRADGIFLSVQSELINIEIELIKSLKSDFIIQQQLRGGAGFKIRLETPFGRVGKPGVEDSRIGPLSEYLADWTSRDSTCTQSRNYESMFLELMKDIENQKEHF